MMEKITLTIRRAVLAVLGDVGLYAFVAFLFASFSDTQFFMYVESANVLRTYIVLPWGLALCLLRFERAQARRLAAIDMGLLGVLMLWIIVPFAMRFGLTFDNAESWSNHAIACFAIYAILREEEPERRARIIDRFCAVTAAFAFVFGALLLYCAISMQTFGSSKSGNLFGVVRGNLYAGIHYNLTAMISLALMMFCLVGVARRKHPLARVAHAIPAAMMAVVVVLTQSRTSRIAVLVGLGVTAYGVLSTRMHARAVVRHATGIVCALAIFVVGHTAADALTRAAVAHYNGEPVFVAAAVAEEVQPTPKPEHMVRPEGEMTFTGRTTIWKHFVEIWKENPRHLIIGNGAGRANLMVGERMGYKPGYSVAAHNGVIQYIADYGLIGFLLLAAFFVSILRPMLRAFYAHGEKHVAGTHVWGGLIAATLTISLMEVQPLTAMTSINSALCIALGVLAGEGWLVNER